jgi:hypothetical protein
MVELFYQVFPGMRNLPPETIRIFWEAVLLWPFMMIGVFYLSKLGLWLDKTWGISVKLKLLWFYFTAGTNELDDKGHNKAVIERINKRAK